MSSACDREDRRARVLELRRAGWTYDDIALEVGVSHAQARLDAIRLAEEGYDLPFFPRGRRKPPDKPKPVDPDPPTPLLPRQPGEAHYHCLYCQRWLCDEPLKLCDGCRAGLAEASVGMPEIDRAPEAIRYRKEQAP